MGDWLYLISSVITFQHGLCSKVVNEKLLYFSQFFNSRHHHLCSGFPIERPSHHLTMMLSRNLFITVSLPFLLLSTGVTSQGSNPPCYICDGDAAATISNPDAIATLPPDLAAVVGLPTLPCSIIYDAGRNGLIPAATCDTTSTEADELQRFCGCSNFVETTPVAPVAAPVEAPMAIPVATPAPVVDVPTDDGTPAPADVPTETPPPVTKPPTIPTIEPPGEGCSDGKDDKDKKGMKCQKAPKQTKAPKEEKMPKQTKAPKEVKEPKEPKPPKEEKIPKEPKTPKEPKDPKEEKAAKAGKKGGKEKRTR